MKKIYNAPQTEIHLMTLTTMVCTSEVLNKADESASEAGVTEADSRRYRRDVWDDEELEEEEEDL